jgi:hypothetical protein
MPTVYRRSAEVFPYFITFIWKKEVGVGDFAINAHAACFEMALEKLHTMNFCSANGSEIQYRAWRRF